MSLVFQCRHHLMAHPVIVQLVPKKEFALTVLLPFHHQKEWPFFDPDKKIQVIIEILMPFYSALLVSDSKSNLFLKRTHIYFYLGLLLEALEKDSLIPLHLQAAHPLHHSIPQSILDDRSILIRSIFHFPLHRSRLPYHHY